MIYGFANPPPPNPENGQTVMCTNPFFSKLSKTVSVFLFLKESIFGKIHPFSHDPKSIVFRESLD